MVAADEIADYFDRLWPLNRSLTGDGVRESLRILAELVPIEHTEVPSGASVFDWIVPPEWNVREAYVVTPRGDRILDFRENNLHLLGYSTSFEGKVTRGELEDHLYSLPAQPTAIPYVTSYYEPRWGFCLSQEQRDGLEDGDYRVVVDAEHRQGSLTIGEIYLPGETEREVLFSTYLCHPSLANNELSGPLVTAFLAREVSRMPQRRLSYRFVFVPETIGSLCLLHLRGEHLLKHLAAGYVVTCVGTDTPFTLKRSRRHASLADRAAVSVLRSARQGFIDLDFFPDGGSDERQYCSPGFNLPVASVMRAMYGTYPEYHTSLDNRDLISFSALSETVDLYSDIVAVLEANGSFQNLSPFGEPQLGRRGLYPTLGTAEATQETSATMWLLNMSDGEHDLLQVSEQSGHSVALLRTLADRCVASGLLDALPVP